MSSESEDITSSIQLPVEDQDTLSISSRSSSIVDSASDNTIDSDRATIIGSHYQSASSSHSNSIVLDTLLPSTMSALIPYKPPTNTTAPSASVLKYLTKLSTGNFVSWRRDLEIHLDSCGLGGFISDILPEPTVVADIPLWRMHRAQVLMAI